VEEEHHDNQFDQPNLSQLDYDVSTTSKNLRMDGSGSGSESGGWRRGRVGVGVGGRVGKVWLEEGGWGSVGGGGMVGGVWVEEERRVWVKTHNSPSAFCHLKVTLSIQ